MPPIVTRILYTLLGLLSAVIAVWPRPLHAARRQETAPPLYKLVIEETGLYRITYAELPGLATFPLPDLRKIGLHSRGQTVALTVDDDGDRLFGPGDAILFYGEGIDRRAPEALYTTEAIYWLEMESPTPVRMAERSAAPCAGQPLPTTFLATQHSEAETVYWQSMPAGAGRDHWFWGPRLSPQTNGLDVARSYPLSLDPPPAATGAATVRVALTGVTTGAHMTSLLLNGHPIAVSQWQGQTDHHIEVLVDAGLLAPQANEITVSALDAGPQPDQILVNWIELDYPALFQTDRDRITLTPPAGTQQFTVNGFSVPELLLFDVTAPLRPIRLTQTVVSRTANGYAVTVCDPGQEMPRYVVAAASQVHSVQHVIPTHPSNWKSPQQAADLILIVHSELAAEAARLADHRRRQGLRVAVVDVADLYVEFSHGLFDPRAIQDFLAYAAAHWRAPAPRYVLLIGDAYQDYRNLLHSRPVNLVPSLLVDSMLFGETVSDTRFVTDKETGLPHMAVGRLPAQTPAELAAMIDNLLAYEAAGAEAAWTQRALLVSDDDEPAFRALSAAVQAQVPPAYTVTEIAVGPTGPANPAAAVTAAWRGGAALVNYVGHGEFFRWGLWQNQAILGPTDLAGLAGSAGRPVVIVADCLNGYFAGPYPSLGEGLLTVDQGGAAAVWAPTATGSPAGHRVLLDAFYAALFRDDIRVLGDAVNAALTTTLAHSSAWRELVDTYVLLGDPAMPLQLHPAEPSVLAVVPGAGSTDIPLDVEVAIIFNKRMETATVTVDGVPLPPDMLRWNAARTELRARPVGLQRGKTVVFAVEGTDRLGLPLAAAQQPLTWSVHVTQDAVPPTVTIDTAAVNQQPTAPIELWFSEAVRPSSVAVEIVPAPRGSDPEEEPLQLHWDAAGRSTWLEHPPLEQDVLYRVRVSAAMDLAGNNLTAPVETTVTPGQTTQQIFLPLVIHR